MGLNNTKILGVACGCFLLCSCNQPKTPMGEEALPFQDKMQTLCDLYRTDLYNFSEKAATTRSDAEFKDSLIAAESATKFLNMLNCRRWKPF